MAKHTKKRVSKKTRKKTARARKPKPAKVANAGTLYTTEAVARELGVSKRRVLQIAAQNAIVAVVDLPRMKLWGGVDLAKFKERRTKPGRPDWRGR